MKHLQAAGFSVESENVQLGTVEVRQKVPASVRSCHTATVGGYIVEGHVPAIIIERLLREKPEIVGVSVPGMVAGSPGMESSEPVAYEVIAWRPSGETFVYAKIGADGKASH